MALAEARKAVQLGEVPVGALVVADGAERRPLRGASIFSVAGGGQGFEPPCSRSAGLELGRMRRVQHWSR